MRSNLAFVLVSLFVATAAPAADQPELLGGVPIMVPDGSGNGQVLLMLRNKSGSPVPLTLSLGNFESRVTGRTLATQVTFFKGAATAGAPFLDDKLEARQTLPIRVQVSNLWESGESTATLTLNDTKHTLHALRSDVPFNVGILSPEGWEIAHYFRNAAEAQFKVKFSTAGGAPVFDAQGKDRIIIEAPKIPLQAPPEDKRRDLARIEGGRLLLALAVAAIALVAGAREQLLKLDLFLGLIGVFTVGFGADTIKNLFAKRS